MTLSPAVRIGYAVSVSFVRPLAALFAVFVLCSACIGRDVPLTGRNLDAGRALDAGVHDAGGSPDATSPDAGGLDAWVLDIGPRPDGAVCTSKRLVPIYATRIGVLDPGPFNTERSLRVTLFHPYLSTCQTPAMPKVEIDAATRVAEITARVWVELGSSCGMTHQADERVVTLRLPAPGNWEIRAGGSPGIEARVDVVAPPPRPCGNQPGGGCEMDCDCQGGMKCIGGWGLGGPFSACAHPCEEDMDCSEGRCTSVPDGLAFTCETYVDQCIGMSPMCPEGYSCDSGACEPDFFLGSGTRTPCWCDADCTPPLNCVQAEDPNGPSRCELACPSVGARWCSGGHNCGSREDDFAQIAQTDSVCGWVGD